MANQGSWRDDERYRAGGRDRSDITGPTGSMTAANMAALAGRTMGTTARTTGAGITSKKETEALRASNDTAANPTPATVAQDTAARTGRRGTITPLAAITAARATQGMAVTAMAESAPAMAARVMEAISRSDRPSVWICLPPCLPSPTR
jgi:hypothetical protein